MSETVKVNELARKAGLSNKEMIAFLRQHEYDVESHSSEIPAEDVELLLEEVHQEMPDAADDAQSEDAIHLKPPVTVGALAEALDLKANELITELIKMGTVANINQTLESSVITQICQKHNRQVVIDKRARPSGGSRVMDIAPEDEKFADDEVEVRPPVVAFLGHVDHGKTSLQDRMRSTDVTDHEAGGITQHIGASNIVWKDSEGKEHPITFIDTPGHEAFTAMRARGAETTDICILVVAADDGIKPQTVEALNHIQAAGVPMIVAVNKMDLPTANRDQVLLQLQQNNITPEDWGGEVGVIGVSALTGDGMNDLMERIILEAELLELGCNSKLPCRAVVVESQVEPGLGVTASVLIKNGTIKVGDGMICGSHYGRVKALIDYRGKRLKKAGPSFPVKVVGLNGVPDCGTVLASVKNERQAKKLCDERTGEQREQTLRNNRQANLEDLFRQIEEEARQNLNVIVKSDVQGTMEAVCQALGKLDSDKIRLNILRSAVGGITENDVKLAKAGDAIIVGFHVRVEQGVSAIARREGVDIRLYSIIYELTAQIRESLEGMLQPELRENALGEAEILQLFELRRSKDRICGCAVRAGVMRVGAKARVHRGEDLIYNGSIASLRHFRDDVREMRQGFECGIRLDNFNDFEIGDRIEVYDYKEIAAKLEV